MEDKEDAFMRNVLVTGAQGFLGSYISSVCAAEFKRVVAVDCHAPTQPVPDNVRAVTSDVTASAFQEIVRKAKPDLLVHAAGPASVGASMKDPAGDFHGALDSWLAVLDAVRLEAPNCRTIFLSSAAVYGQPDALPVREETPLRPMSPYGYHKRMAEELLHEYHSVYGIEGCSLRIFSAYGAGLKKQVLYDICLKALKQPTVELFGTGDETRDFLHGRDVAEAVVTIARRGRFEADIYNVASGTETSIEELARTLLSALKCEKPLRFNGQRRGGDPLRWRADVTRLNDLGFQPTIPLQAGVGEYASWVKQQA